MPKRGPVALCLCFPSCLLPLVNGLRVTGASSAWLSSRWDQEGLRHRSHGTLLPKDKAVQKVFGIVHGGLADGRGGSSVILPLPLECTRAHLMIPCPCCAVESGHLGGAGCRPVSHLPASRDDGWRGWQSRLCLANSSRRWLGDAARSHSGSQWPVREAGLGSDRVG